MRVDRDPRAGGPAILGFGPSGFRIDDRSYPAALLTTGAAHAWAPRPLDTLTIEDLQTLVAATPEFILLGTGNTLVRPPAALIGTLEARGIGLEPMDSRAAARALGVLRGEGREVAAALYPIS